MTPLVILVTAAAMGIEVGWEPIAEGGHEYTIQIEPQLLDLLKRGQDEIVSEVPPNVHIRRYRVLVGTGTLPRVDGAAEPAAVVHEAEPAGAPAWSRDSVAPPFDDKELADRPQAAPSDEHPKGPETAEGTHEEAPSNTATLEIPGHLPKAAAEPSPLGAQPAGFNAPHDSTSQEVDLKKPELGAGEAQPWMPFVVAALLLCCSLGANLYLGWVAWDARSRYREAIAKFRTAPAA
jgi:hypothetical protein